MLVVPAPPFFPWPVLLTEESLSLGRGLPVRSQRPTCASVYTWLFRLICSHVFPYMFV